MLPEQLQGPGWAVACARVSVAGGAASCAPAWQSGCWILVPGGGKGSAPAATARATVASRGRRYRNASKPLADH